MATVGLQRLLAEPSGVAQQPAQAPRIAPPATTSTPTTEASDPTPTTEAPADAMTREAQKRAADFVARGSGLSSDSGAKQALIKRFGSKLDDLKPFAQTLLRYGSATTAEKGEIQQQWASHVGALVSDVKSNSGASDPGFDVNGLMQYVLEQSYLQGTGDLGMYAQKVKYFNQLKSDIRDELNAARKALAGMQGLQTSGGTVTTPGGYQVINDGGRQWRIVEPNGKEHRVWGDPHVDENNDGTSDWHFDRDGTFVLPDGTKIFCDTTKTGTKGAGDITVSDTIVVLSGDSMVTMDVTKAGSAEKSWGGVAWDKEHDDGSVFVLANDHQWKDGATLGDLYDGGGDFIADVNVNAKGTVSEAAAKVLAGGVAGNGEPIYEKNFQTEPTFDADGNPVVNAFTGDPIYGREELENYIKSLEEKLASVGDDAQLANVDLQNSLQQQQQTLQMMSNISKMLNDTAMAVIRKIG